MSRLEKNKAPVAKVQYEPDLCQKPGELMSESDILRMAAKVPMLSAKKTRSAKATKKGTSKGKGKGQGKGKGHKD